MNGVSRRSPGGKVFIAGFLLWTLFPVYWMISTSLKAPLDTTATPPVFFPSLDISAYTTALGNELLRSGILHSFLVAVGATAVAVLAGALAAYGATHLAMQRMENFEFWVLSSRMAPPVAVAIPFFLMYQAVGLYDTIAGLVLAHVVVVVGIVTWILIEGFRSLPRELVEAGLVDGLNYWQVFRTILLPLAAPGMVAAASISFLLSWNDFFFALILTKTEAVTAPLAIYQAIGFDNIDLGQLAATSTLVLIPTALVVGIFQRQLVAGLTMGATKG